MNIVSLFCKIDDFFSCVYIAQVFDDCADSSTAAALKKR